MHNWVTRAEAGLPTNILCLSLDTRIYVCLICGANVVSGMIMPHPDAMIDNGKILLKSCEEFIANKIMES